MSSLILKMAASLTSQQYRAHYPENLLVPWQVASILNKFPKYLKAVIRGNKMRPFAKRDFSKLPSLHLGISIQLGQEFFRLLLNLFIIQ
jgi:hypothetical protein